MLLLTNVYFRRTVKAPSKDMVKLFIRGFALRHQNASPWVVQADMLKKYNIPNKFADFLCSPSKVCMFNW